MDEPPSVDILIDIALNEDLQNRGDITSESVFTNEKHVFKLIAKDKGVLCGIEVFERVINKTDPAIIISKYFRDGDAINKGDVIAEISGNVISILKSERTALNFLSILSGVATKTAEYVKKAEGRSIVIDTRKTIPAIRKLQKYAVRCGGGGNHRMGLFDMIMIKDNHIDAAGGISAAVEKTRNKWGDRFKIVVETRNMAEIKEALTCKVDRILLDNMKVAEIKEAVRLIDGACETEASGNITLESIKSVALTGVDYISSGDLTNSIKAFDFSLKEK